MLSVQEIKSKIREKHGDRVTIDESTYISPYHLARFIDFDYGEWFTIPYRIFHYGNGHPKRGRANWREKHSLSIDEIVARLKERHGDKITLDVSTYVNVKIKARFIDNEYGEWWAAPGNVITNGQQHRKRATADVLTRRNGRSTNYISIDEVKRRIEKTHGALITIVENTYDRINRKATFIDAERGQFISYVVSVCNGVGHPSRTQDKWLASCKKFVPVLHWKTGVLCHIQSGYEHAVISWLNKNQYDFDWQIPIQTELIDKRGKKRIYIVDAFIKSGNFANTYVEIKGTWNTKVGELGMQKWTWFHAIHPNSVLWTEKTLIELGIFQSGKKYLRKLRKVSLWVLLTIKS